MSAARKILEGLAEALSHARLSRTVSASDAARILGARAHQRPADPGNMNKLRREMGMPEWRRG